MLIVFGVLDAAVIAAYIALAVSGDPVPAGPVNTLVMVGLMGITLALYDNWRDDRLREDLREEILHGQQEILARLSAPAGTADALDGYSAGYADGLARRPLDGR